MGKLFSLHFLIGLHFILTCIKHLFLISPSPQNAFSNNRKCFRGNDIWLLISDSFSDIVQYINIENAVK